MHLPWQPTAPAPVRRAGWAVAVAAVLAATVWWSMPALRAQLEPEAAPVLDPDVCVVAPPTPYNPASGLPLEPDVCIVAPPTAYDPASGLPPMAARAVPADARCPVCGMFPARSPQWAAQIIFTNGDAQFFDSPLSLFMYLQDVERYSPGRSAGQIAAHYVTDASAPPAGTGAPWIDALSAYYVHGSSAKGPMRAGNLPAFATREAAQAFAERRGGVVLAFGAIDAALVAQLAGSGGHSHH